MYQNYGFTAPSNKLVQSADEAVAFARQLGGPMVMKIASPQILHKTDVGGVALNLMEEEEIRRAYARILASVKAARPEAVIEGVEVQEMVTRGSKSSSACWTIPVRRRSDPVRPGRRAHRNPARVSFRVLPIERSDARR